MERTGERTNWLVRGLTPGVEYKAEVFALNTATNFSYRFAEMERLVYSRPKARALPDGLTTSADLGPHQPLIVFRYKVRSPCTSRYS